MSHTLTVDVPEKVYTAVVKTAEQMGQLPETLIAQWLTTITEHLMDDPVEQFIGAFSTHVADWADNHDTYIGKAILNAIEGEGETHG